MKNVETLMKEASDFGMNVCREKGLLVYGDETPSDHQRGIAALHGREDAAACFFLLTHVLKRQQTLARWLYFVVFLLLGILSKLS